MAVYRRFSFTRFASLASFLFLVCATTHAASLDFSNAQILVRDGDAASRAVAEMLKLEVERRSGVALTIGTSARDATPTIVLGRVDNYPPQPGVPAGLTVPDTAECFAVAVDKTSATGQPAIHLVGRDAKGVLFATGYLLRKMYMARGFVHVKDDLRVSTAPAYPIRGHQIILKSQNNERYIDWYDPAQVQQYIRDLAIFGNNIIEPTTESNDFADMSAYCESLNIDLAYTVNCDQIIELNSRPDSEISAWLSDVKGIDQFVTYGGDHGGARPPFKTFPAMERVVPLVLASHPGATWWYSNQCMGGPTSSHAVSYDNYIFPYLTAKQPAWLTGVVYGPWTRRGIPDIRADLPSQYKIRHYPDICHVQWCQYPVPKWDRPWVQVWERAANIYAMPRTMKAIHNAVCKDTAGSIAYNHTGVCNDLNKFVFLAMGWNPEEDLDELLRDYARVFMAYSFVYPTPSVEAIDGAVDRVARALQGLEDNWTGPLADNPSPERCAGAWKEIARLMGEPARVRDNWRVDMFLTRALIDAQVKRKYDAEMRHQDEAYKALGSASATGFAMAVADARTALARTDTEFKSKADFENELRSYGVSDRYGDMEKTLNRLYLPLSDRGWIESQLDGAMSAVDLDAIVHYEDPGPGGFYDDLGNEAKQPHLVRTKSWEEDPGFVYSPFDWNDSKPGTRLRQSQHSHALARYDNPLVMKWEGLDPSASYYIEVVYGGPFNPEFQCDTDDGFEIHRPRANGLGTRDRYDIPAGTLHDGVLQLEWRLLNTTRGVSVAEIWLRKEAR